MPMLPYPLYTLISLWFLLACSLTLSSNANASDTSMIDLTKPNEYQLWRSTNDNVMGGISQGAFAMTARRVCSLESYHWKTMAALVRLIAL